METIQQEQDTRKPIIQELRELREYKREKEAPKEKLWKIPFKWKFKFKQSKSIKKVDQILVMMFNKKNQIESPKFMPIYGNIIVYHDKVYKYNPKAIWTMLVVGKPQIYCIREIDMEPISNLDIAKVIREGRSTQYHKLLLQAALAAQMKPTAKPMNMILIVIVILVVVGGLLWFFLKG
jgi:hypothetical protein